MGSKAHFYISLAKSIIRIAACMVALKKRSVKPLAIGFGGAELLGVLEEVYDKR